MKPINNQQLSICIWEENELFTEDLRFKLDYAWPEDSFIYLPTRNFSELPPNSATDQPLVIFLAIERLHEISYYLNAQPQPDVHIVLLQHRHTLPVELLDHPAIQTLCKPIAIEALLTLYAELETQYQALAAIGQANQVAKRLILSDQDGVRFIDPERIVMCKANNNYTVFFFAEEKRWVYSQCLKQVSLLLQPYGFFRSHQSYLVNPDYVRGYTKGLIKLEGNYEAYLSKSKKEAFFDFMQGTAA